MVQSLFTRNENILGGIAVFAGTRVPIKTLFDYLKANHPLDDFLDDFPTVARGRRSRFLNRFSHKSRTQLMRPPMRLLLDECLPRKLKRGLPGHMVLT